MLGFLLSLIAFIIIIVSVIPIQPVRLSKEIIVYEIPVF